jgi:GMP synthase-like glutamine amidotransferase
MGIVYVDLEHGRIVQDPVAGASHRTRLDTARTRLEAAAGETCDIIRFEEVTLDRIRSLTPSAMVISGSTADWSEYDIAGLAGLIDTIRAAPMPILGICGGHQLIGRAHGTTWGPIGRVREGDFDPDPRFAPGMHKQRGFHQIDVDGCNPLFRKLGEVPVVFQSHYWHLTSIPAGFIACASSIDSPIQAIMRLDRPVFGVQFHPERFDHDHQDGETVLRNFFATARGDAPLLSELELQAEERLIAVDAVFSDQSLIAGIHKAQEHEVQLPTGHF